MCQNRLPTLSFSHEIHRVFKLYVASNLIRAPFIVQKALLLVSTPIYIIFFSRSKPSFPFWRKKQIKQLLKSLMICSKVIIYWNDYWEKFVFFPGIHFYGGTNVVECNETSFRINCFHVMQTVWGISLNKWL